MVGKSLKVIAVVVFVAVLIVGLMAIPSMLSLVVGFDWGERFTSRVAGVREFMPGSHAQAMATTVTAIFTWICSLLLCAVLFALGELIDRFQNSKSNS